MQVVLDTPLQVLLPQYQEILLANVYVQASHLHDVIDVAPNGLFKVKTVTGISALKGFDIISLQ